MDFQLRVSPGELQNKPWSLSSSCMHTRSPRRKRPLVKLPGAVRVRREQGWDQAWGRAVWGDELLSLRLGPAAGWGFPPEAAVRAGCCWVLGTAPGFGALEMTLEMGGWSVVSIGETRGGCASGLISAALHVHGHH